MLSSRDAQVGRIVKPDADRLGCPVREGEPVPSVCGAGVATIEDDTTTLWTGDVRLRKAATSRFVLADPLPSVGIATAKGTAKPGFP